MLKIRQAEPTDHEAIWEIFHEVVTQTYTYPYPPETNRQQALEIWIQNPAATYVAEMEGETVGTYYIKPNQPGLGSHVCNCGYMVAGSAHGQGVGSAMCKHSQEEASGMGFRAMQFNLVVSSNKTAVKLWQKLGFKITGTLPGAFQHRRLGFIDAHVMYKWLEK